MLVLEKTKLIVLIVLFFLVRFDVSCRVMLCISVASGVVRCLSSWLVSATFVYCVETTTDTAIVALECEHVTVHKLLNGTVFNDLE